MKTYNTTAEVEAGIIDGVLWADDDITFACDVSIPLVRIKARDIKARDIKAWGIRAHDIKAGDIKARGINARDIGALNINARYINARDVSYYAYCIAYNSITCRSAEGRRKNHLPPTCLDGELTYR